MIDTKDTPPMSFSPEAREAGPTQRKLRPLVYPSWPTSKPGPETTLPPPGQKQHPLRTDQVIYESYDQERGRDNGPQGGLQ